MRKYLKGSITDTIQKIEVFKNRIKNCKECLGSGFIEKEIDIGGKKRKATLLCKCNNFEGESFQALQLKEQNLRCIYREFMNEPLNDGKLDFNTIESIKDKNIIWLDGKNRESLAIAIAYYFKTLNNYTLLKQNESDIEYDLIFKAYNIDFSKNSIIVINNIGEYINSELERFYKSLFKQVINLNIKLIITSQLPLYEWTSNLFKDNEAIANITQNKIIEIKGDNNERKLRTRFDRYYFKVRNKKNNL